MEKRYRRGASRGPVEALGQSEIFLEFQERLSKVAPVNRPVLLLGERGTGKELAANRLHYLSNRWQGPFLTLNCSALSPSLIESELFGFEKGAFTGASERKLGKFEIAQNGTIFLDEIGNLLPGLQQKLLRVLQEREFKRLGGEVPIKVQARFIAATNRNLLEEIRKGSFREDLFFRLNVVAVKLPPLRERTDDIPLLANYFIAKYNEHLNKNIKGFSSDAASILNSYQFPGNVRSSKTL